jgi:nucleoside-diphosphate-sugar epimerase
MRVLVLGGTGAMGAHLVGLLAEKGIQTFVTSRGHKNSCGNISYLQGNAQSMDFLHPILREKWDAIVDFMVYSTPAFEARVNLLLEATDQYVFLSSARVYAESPILITEGSPRLLNSSLDAEFLSTDEYSLSKARQEDILERTGKINWTIIRPYITYSENRLQLGILEKEEWLYRAVHGRTIVFSSDIYSKVTTMTYGLDVAKSMVVLIGNQSAFGEIYHITAGTSITWKDVLEIYLDVFEKKIGHRPKVFLQDLGGFMKCKRAKYQIVYDRLYDRKFNQLQDISVFQSGRVRAG